MLAAVLNKPGDLEIREVPDPKPGAGELVVKVGATTLCGSDVRIHLGQKTGGVGWPAVIGHEFAGTIGAIGAELVGFDVGDAVAVVPWIPCGACGACRTGHQNLCADLRILGYQEPGALSEYVRVPADAVAAGLVFPVAGDVPAEYLALAEPLACVVHGHRRSDIQVGQRVLIIGGGPIGQLHLQLALLAGAADVIVSEPSAMRREYAKRAGASRVVDPTAEDLRAAVAEETGGLGVEHTILCIGYGALVDEAIASTRLGGRVNLFAGFGGDGVAEVNVNLVHYRELDVIGNSGGTRDDYQLALELITTGRVDVSAMVTDRFRLSDTAAALSAAAAGDGMKVAVLPQDS